MKDKERTRFIGTVVCTAILVVFSISGCVSDDELNRMNSSISYLNSELNRYRGETDRRLDAITKEQERMGKHLLNLSTSIEEREDRIRTILGKLDELEHQIQIYWNETKNEIGLLKKRTPSEERKTENMAAAKTDEGKRPGLEESYKEAFDSFQKGNYEDAINRFSALIESYPDTPLVPNAYYWIGEAYMNLRNYEKAIVNFQVIVEKYPKSEKVPRALLSQADAFARLKDEKSSMTILKKVIELFPKTEEAIIAERRLRSLTSPRQ